MMAYIGLFRGLSSRTLRLLSSRAVLEEPSLSGHNAYELLGVSETASSAEVKTSFHKLAKEYHPDVAPSKGASASRQFLRILAAYEILSDAERRAHYDSYLLSQQKVPQRQHHPEKMMHAHKLSVSLVNQPEVADWLKSYRFVIEDILSRKRCANGSGYWNDIENELYAAIHAAYYGPLIESMEFLPACFEAEERSSCETAEVLHLVSGRDLFGIVYVLNQVPRLGHIHTKKLSSHQPNDPVICGAVNISTNEMQIPPSENLQNSKTSFKNISDAYQDLELHISGKLVATAIRIPPDIKGCNCPAADSQDVIHVFLKLNEVFKLWSQELHPDFSVPYVDGSMIPLGTIKGLGTSPEEGYAFVYDAHGVKTHLIAKHRTLLVKHMHWFSVEDDALTCECRCSRARLPSSKYWLFEPRCGMHDVGGWYIETFGRENNGKTVLSQRQWEGNRVHQGKRLHPAIYLLALAYRTLDIEAAVRKKRSVKNIVVRKLLNVLQWCRKHFVGDM